MPDTLPYIVDVIFDAAAEPGYLPISALAKHAGVSQSTLCRWLTHGGLPLIAVGRRIVGRPAEVDEWRERRRAAQNRPLDEILAPLLKKMYAAGWRPRGKLRAVVEPPPPPPPPPPAPRPERPVHCHCALCRERRGEPE